MSSIRDQFSKHYVKATGKRSKPIWEDVTDLIYTYSLIGWSNKYNIIFRTV